MGAAPKKWGLSQPPGAEAAPSPRGLGGWGSPQPQPPKNRGLGAAPGGGGQPPGAGGSPRGLGTAPGVGGSPRGWGQPLGAGDSPDWWQPLKTARAAGVGAGGKITLEYYFIPISYFCYVINKSII